MVTRIGRLAAALAAGVLMLVGCGERSAEEDDAVVSAARPSVNLVPEGYDGRFRTWATVLESVSGWDWTKVQARSVAGTTWGNYVLVGTFDGETFRLTEPARMDGGGGGRSGGDSLVTPCPEPPEGGWQPVDPGRATGKAFRYAMRRARATDGFGDLWIDQQIPPKQLTEWNSNDPKRFVLNIATTGDVGAMESGVREVWGGSLCVSQSPRSAAELAAIRRSLSEIPGLLTVGSNGRAGQVEVGLVLATEELQAKLDERYGEGAVRLFGQLEPIDPVREPLPEP